MMTVNGIPQTCFQCGAPATTYWMPGLTTNAPPTYACAAHAYGTPAQTQTAIIDTLEADNVRLRTWQAEAVALLREDVEQGTDDAMCFHCDTSDAALAQSGALGMSHQPRCRMQRILNHIAAAEETTNGRS